MTASSATSQRAALIERFTAPGQPFEMGERTVRGVPMRVYTTGPLTRRNIALASMGAADRPFLICRDERWSYAEQARIIAGLARCLAGEPGLRKGDRVAVCMRNYPEWTLVVWAAQVTGLLLVEAALSEHPAIVVPRDGARLAAVGVQRHVAGRLVSFKVPARVVFRSAPLPRTQSGKVLKPDLRSAIASELRDG